MRALRSGFGPPEADTEVPSALAAPTASTAQDAVAAALSSVPQGGADLNTPSLPKRPLLAKEGSLRMAGPATLVSQGSVSRLVANMTASERRVLGVQVFTARRSAPKSRL